MSTPTDAVRDPALATHKGLNAALWLCQVLLAVAFGMAGAMKLVTPVSELARGAAWVADAALLVRFIGVAEVAGALGLILPAVTRIKPRLVPLAALGLVAVMVLATAFHLVRGEGGAVPVPLFLGAMAAFVAWGRSRKLPFPAR